MMRLALIVLLLGAASLARGADAPPGVAVFAAPRLETAERGIEALLRAGRVEEARWALSQLRERFPKAPHLVVAEAEIAGLTGDLAAAEDALAAAVAMGSREAGEALARQPLNAFAGRGRLAEIAAAAPGPAPPPHVAAPSLARDGALSIGPANTRWDEVEERLIAQAEFAPRVSRFPLRSHGGDEAWAQLDQLVRRGFAAGNAGDLYDNRDDGHSALKHKGPEQITRTVYGPEARAEGLHFGLNLWMGFDAPVIGNSSTAVKGRRGRSLARLALTAPGGAAALAQQYLSNEIYVYPEHRDHDPDRGDLFPANTPYQLVSQGSSGSDRRIVRALQFILAALPPDTKAKLQAAGWLAPAAQQIFRRAYAGEAAYLSGAAHPAAFVGGRIDFTRLLELAQAMTPDSLPPLARIRLTREPKLAGPVVGPLGELLFDTPHAVARVWRGVEGRRSYVLDASASRDLDGGRLTFDWVLLRGDAEAVRVTPLGDGAQAQVDVAWSGGTEGPGGIASSRIDIAVFAHNGAHHSAPAFFSLALPVHQDRAYASDGARPRAVDFGLAPPKGVYVDTTLWPQRRWAEDYAYDAAGRLKGWTRRYPGGAEARFTAHGLKATAFDRLGRPLTAELVAHRADPSGGTVRVVEAPTGRMFGYTYAGPDDEIGMPAEQR